MKKIAILGNKDTIAGFRALGVQDMPVNTKEEALHHLKTIKEQANKYGILFITENWHTKLIDNLSEMFAQQALPAIIAIPSAKGSGGAGMANIKRIVEKAIGSDILS